MKKSYLFLIIIIFFIGSNLKSYGCEICGCSTGNFQIGLLPNFSKGFLGFRYSTSRYNSIMSDNATEYSHDYYKTMELWGGYNYKKIQFLAIMPYVFSKKISDDGTTTSNGVGDLMLLVNYKVFSFSALLQNEKTTMRNEIYVGGGIKLPTGISQVDTGNPDFNIGDFNSQAGTGSADYLINITHNLMWNNSGIVTNAAYRINTNNKYDYRFGNRYYLNTAYFHTFSKGVIKIKPNVGMSFQSNGVNYYKGSKVEGTDGYNLNTTLGVNVLRNKIGLNAMGFIPTFQNLYDGQTKLQSRFILGLTYSF